MVLNFMTLKALRLTLILVINFALYSIAILTVLGKKVLSKKIMNISGIFFLKALLLPTYLKMIAILSLLILILSLDFP